MKRLIFLTVLMLVFGLVFVGCDLVPDINQLPVAEQDGIVYETKHTGGDPYRTNLIAGGGNPASEMDVGEVLVWNDVSTLYVKYVIDEPDWCITKTHLQVATSLNGIKQKKGNPIPGRFDYKEEHVCVTEYTYEIPIKWAVGTELFIAAHANVEKLCLPDMVEMELTWPGGSPPDYSYFLTFIDSTTLNGSFGGWCADAYTYINLNETYGTTYVYSSLDGINPPDCILERPWGSINWLLNNWQTISTDWEDAQVAIWTLIHGGSYPCGCIINPGNNLAYTPAYVDALIASGIANEDYVPVSGELVAVILLVDNLCPVGDPSGSDKQMIFIGIPRDELYCQSETAWGDGLDFPGANWATYFMYTVQ